jgi:hypothetical protein
VTLSFSTLSGLDPHIFWRKHHFQRSEARQSSLDCLLIAWKALQRAAAVKIAMENGKKLGSFQWKW